MLTHAMMEKAKMLQAIEQLENAVSLGLVSEEEIMKNLQDKFGAETKDFAPRYEIQIRTSRGNVTERIPVSAGMLVRRIREILGRGKATCMLWIFLELNQPSMLWVLMECKSIVPSQNSWLSTSMEDLNPVRWLTTSMKNWG